MLTIELNKTEKLTLLETLIDELSTVRLSIGSLAEKKMRLQQEDERVMLQLKIGKETQQMAIIAGLIQKLTEEDK